MVKLKIKTKGDSHPPTPSSENPPTPSSGGVKLKIKTGSVSGPSQTSPPAPFAPPAVPADLPKPKRKYTKKKDKVADDGETPEKGKPGRKRKAKEVDDGDGEAKAPKKQKAQGTAGAPIAMKIRIPTTSVAAVLKEEQDASTGYAPKVPTPTGTSTLKLRLSAKQRTLSTPNIKLKAKGKPPYRPLAVGYDSEGEDIEVDPAIEHQFILRMQPGEDCDHLREAIANKRIGASVAAGGAEVSMRFFDKEGRRAMVTIRGHHYAASLLDLPCIIESMKSWDRKGWYKSADVCQMLLVTQRVTNEEEARNAPLPREVDAVNWQYPHGLTPPMHYVRKRRFRKRLNFRTIEAVEDEVERLLREDEQIESQGGSIEFQLMDYDAYLRESELDEERAAAEAEAEAEADAEGANVGLYGEVIPGYEPGDDEDAPGEAEAEGDLAALMEQEFAAAGADDGAAARPQAITTTAVITTDGPLHASPTALQPLGPGATPLTAATAATPSEAASATNSGLFSTENSSDDEDDDDDEGFDDDDDDDADSPPVADEEEQARLQARQQAREEIADLRAEIEAAEQQAARLANPLLRQRAQAKIRSLRADLGVKLGSLGEDGDGEE